MAEHASWLPPPDSAATCLVTGASSGIGEAIARELARRGHGVTLVGRREAPLRTLAGELSGSSGAHADVVPCDLADANAREELVATVGDAGRRVDVLVNSAGFGAYGTFVELDRGGELEQVRVMSEAVVDLCAAFAPAMAANRRGVVSIVSSSLGLGPAPRYATYTATKAFCIAFGESLHTELRRRGVAVSTLCPGPVETGFFETNGPQPPQRVVPRWLWQSPESVARQALRGLERNKRVVVPGTAMRGAMAAAKPVPRWLRLRAMDRFFTT